MDGDVLVIHIQTIKEQMRYDRTRFIVTPGLKVRLVFSNPDAMDHNLIMVQPDSATRVALAAAKMEEDGTGTDKQWIPDAGGILFASKLLAHNESQIIEFTAPSEPGNYEYICTFPGHWQLMRGVMVVERGIDRAKLAALQPPAEDPSGSERKVVQFWAFDDLKDEVTAAMAARSFETGREMFSVASCVQCHEPRGDSPPIGPELGTLAQQYTPKELLEHIIDPSLAVAEEYQSLIVVADGHEYFGTRIAETETTITLLENPLAPETAQTIAKAGIEEITPINVSPMPADLLITLNKREIWDLVAYVLAAGDPKHPVFTH
jgi:putative heme-binding domain-containing protein